MEGRERVRPLELVTHAVGDRPHHLRHPPLVRACHATPQHRGCKLAQLLARAEQKRAAKQASWAPSCVSNSAPACRFNVRRQGQQTSSLPPISEPLLVLRELLSSEQAATWSGFCP